MNADTTNQESKPLTHSQRQAVALVRFLGKREPTQEEIYIASLDSFNYKLFRLKLLTSSENITRWPRLTEIFHGHCKNETKISTDIHEVAHDLALMKRDLRSAQKKLDHSQTEMLSLIEKIDAGIKLFDDIRDAQATVLNGLKKINEFEKKLLVYMSTMSNH